MGMLKIANRAVFCWVRAEMDDIVLKVAANPLLPNMSETRCKGTLVTGLPKNKTKQSQAKNAKIHIKIML